MNTSNKNKGSITIFVAIIIPVIVTFFFTMVDFTRIVGARNQINMAAENAIESALGSYDSDLYGNYGLLAFKGNDEIKESIREVVKKNLYADNSYQNSFYGYEITDDNIAVDFKGSLFERNIFEEQMIRAMKYQGATNLTLGALTKFTELGKVSEQAEAADELEKLNKDIEKFNEKLEKIEEAKESIKELAKVVFKNFYLVDSIPKYIEEFKDISSSEVNEEQQNFIKQCVTFAGEEFLLKDINITNALTVKFMKYIITAYDKYPLPEVEESDDSSSDDEDDEEESVEKNDEILDSKLSNELDDWCDELIDKFKESLDFDGIKEKLNNGLVAIQYIKDHKGELDSKIAQYESTYLTAENLSGTQYENMNVNTGTYYGNIKSDIDNIKAKLGSLQLDLYAQIFLEGEVIIDLVLSNVETYSSRMDEIEATIDEDSLSESEYEELESYFISMKVEIGLGKEDSINSGNYIKLAKAMVKSLSKNNKLKNSLSTQLKALNNLPVEVINHGLGGLVFTIDPVTLANEGAKNFWNFFKNAKLDLDSLTGVLSNLPGDASIDGDVVSAMPGNNEGDLVPANMTSEEFNNSIKDSGIFHTNGLLGQVRTFFGEVADFANNPLNESLDKLYLIEYIMTYFKNMVDVDTRMPVEYDGDTVLENEIEAIAFNVSYSDFANKSMAVTTIGSVRTILNFISLWNNRDVRIILDSIEASIPLGIGAGIKYSILVGWSLLETRYDLLDIFRGYSVPIIKTQEQWVTKLWINGIVIDRVEQWDDMLIEQIEANVDILVQYPENKEDEYNNKNTGGVKLDYTDICRMLLLVSTKDKLVTRSGNIIYANLNDSNRHFNATEYFTGIKTSVGSDIKKWFNVETFNATGSNGGFRIRPIEIEKSYD